jgi:transposase InsO family protein
VRHFETVEELAAALQEFRQRYNEQWLIERLHFQTPRQAQQARLALEPAA